MAERPTDISTKPIDKLPVSAEVKSALKDIQAEVADAYRESFVEMVQAIRQQASALERIHATLAVLVKHLAPQLEGQLPAAIRVARPGESPDLASAVVVADPIAAGYTLSQTEVARALGISTPDASVLLRAFKLPDDGECAVTVRKGQALSGKFVNYHPRVIDRFRALVADPPSGLQQDARSALKRAKRRLGEIATGRSGAARTA
jgi:hypothetical protein